MNEVPLYQSKLEMVALTHVTSPLKVLVHAAADIRGCVIKRDWYKRTNPTLRNATTFSLAGRQPILYFRLDSMCGQNP